MDNCHRPMAVNQIYGILKMLSYNFVNLAHRNRREPRWKMSNCHRRCVCKNNFKPNVFWQFEMDHLKSIQNWSILSMLLEVSLVILNAHSHESSKNAIKKQCLREIEQTPSKKKIISNKIFSISASQKIYCRKCPKNDQKIQKIETLPFFNVLTR